jgi:hypothetical protein
MSLTLQQHKDNEHTDQSMQLKVGGEALVSDSEFLIVSTIELPLFPIKILPIFCFVEVITCKPADDKYHVN